ncbi:hypothetical protein Rhein_2436, partial [Rheinheimera sp. A13L]|uniref:hypothetical protein n=1 Tax=Rheinheimera sp. A13L TaxID=506534 RepID=UPI0002125231
GAHPLGQGFALLKIAPDNFLFAAIRGAHPLGQCFALLKIAPGNFLCTSERFSAAHLSLITTIVCRA